MPPQHFHPSSPGLTAESRRLESAETRKEILSNGYLYDVTDWIDRHPGGKIIEFYTVDGEDATLAIQQFHHRSADKVEKMLKCFKRRLAPEPIGITEIETKKRHAALTEDFVKLYRELESEGYFKPSLGHAVYRFAELFAIFAIGLYLLYSESLSLRIAGTLTIGLCGGRSGWLMHEAGHNSFTGMPKVDKFLSAFIFGFHIAASSSWWNSQHNRHHAMPQRLHRDVDLDTMPLLAFNAKTVKNPMDGKSIFIKYQSILFATIDSLLVIVFWKLYLHPKRMIYKREYLEIVFVASHMLLAYNYIGFGAYLFVNWFGATYLFTNFALSHTHLPVTTEPTHWVEYGLVHTMDIEPSWLVSWWMGYLNCQIEHHLFPAMPQFRQPQIRHRVRALAIKHDIPYRSCTYMEALRLAFGNLQKVAEHFETA